MMSGEQSCLSGAWLCEPQGRGVTLRHPGDGTVIELEDVELEHFAALWSALSEPHTPRQLQQRFAAFGTSGAELLELFESEGVLRRLAGPAELVAGSGPLSELVFGPGAARWLGCGPHPVFLVCGTAG